MIEKAKALVRDYIKTHTDPTNQDAESTIFVIWQCQVLQNFKCLISATLPHGMYFELTYDGDREMWYFDAYRKIENREVPDELYQQPD
jgi:hypothetical protein